MKRVLLISSMNIKDPLRGTPIRVYNLARQIKGKHDLYVSTADVSNNLSDKFIPFPNKYGRLKRIIFFIRLIFSKKIDIVLVATESNIRLPLILKLFTGVKIAIDLHGISAEEIYFQEKISFIRKWIFDVSTKFYLLFFDAVFVVSEKLKNYYIRFNKNITVIYGGVSGSEVSRLEAQDNQNNNFFVGYTGNTRSYQGLDFLLTAAEGLVKKKQIDLKLNLVLSGDEEKIKKKISSKGLHERTKINFNISHDQVYKVIQPVDVLVIPRPSVRMTEFAFPSKTTEYLLTGIPVIMTKVGPVEELFEDKNIAVIIDPEDITKSLEEALLKVYNMESKDRAKLGKRARKFVEESLTWDKIGKEINSALEKL